MYRPLESWLLLVAVQSFLFPSRNIIICCHLCYLMLFWLCLQRFSVWFCCVCSKTWFQNDWAVASLFAYVAVCGTLETTIVLIMLHLCGCFCSHHSSIRSDPISWPQPISWKRRDSRWALNIVCCKHHRPDLSFKICNIFWNNKKHISFVFDIYVCCNVMRFLFTSSMLLKPLLPGCAPMMCLPLRLPGRLRREETLVCLLLRGLEILISHTKLTFTFFLNIHKHRKQDQLTQNSEAKTFLWFPEAKLKLHINCHTVH